MVRVLLLVVLLLGGCKGAVVVPPRLTGVWVTHDPRYADRYMKFGPHTVTYGIGGGKEISHEIEKIDAEEGKGGTAYTFYYRDSEGEKWTLTLTYRPYGGGMIQIKNSKEIWTKSGDRRSPVVK